MICKETVDMIIPAFNAAASSQKQSGPLQLAGELSDSPYWLGRRPGGIAHVLDWAAV